MPRKLQYAHRKIRLGSHDHPMPREPSAISQAEICNPIRQHGIFSYMRLFYACFRICVHIDIHFFARILHGV